MQSMSALPTKALHSALKIEDLQKQIRDLQTDLEYDFFRFVV